MIVLPIFSSILQANHRYCQYRLDNIIYAVAKNEIAHEMSFINFIINFIVRNV